MSTIKYIAETVSRYRDRNGNCYHFGTITRTSDGAALRITSLGGDSNLRHLIIKNDPDNANHPGTYSVQSWEHARDWNEANKIHSKDALYEHHSDAIAEWFNS